MPFLCMIHNVSLLKHNSESSLTHWRVLQVLCYSGLPVDTLAVAQGGLPICEISRQFRASSSEKIGMPF
jgi:hypothetical protein